MQYRHGSLMIRSDLRTFICSPQCLGKYIFSNMGKAYSSTDATTYRKARQHFAASSSRGRKRDAVETSLQQHLGRRQLKTTDRALAWVSSERQ